MKKIVALLAALVLLTALLTATAEMPLVDGCYRIMMAEDNDLVTLVALDDGNPVVMIVFMMADDGNVYADVPFVDETMMPDPDAVVQMLIDWFMENLPR